MIDEKKIKLMSQTALYREEEREVLKMSEFEDRKKAALAYIKTIPAGAVSYLLLIGLIVFLFPGAADTILSGMTTAGTLALLIAAMFGFLILYALYAGFMSEGKIWQRRGGLWKYKLNVIRLKNIQNSEAKR